MSSSPDAEPPAAGGRGGAHGVELLHVDSALIVAVKPAGLLSVPGRGIDRQDCLASRVQARHADAAVVHRLDMATSGLMLFARGVEPQRRLSRSFAERTVAKRYIAMVHGWPAADAGEIDLPLAADWPNRPKQQVDALGGKPSLTRYQVLDRRWEGGEPCARLALEPVTGRAHQLRVHLLALGHPIVGDALYAPSKVQALAGRLLLHAERLVVPHPASGDRLGFESTPPF